MSQLIMLWNISDYQKLAMRTAPGDYRNLIEDLQHAQMGITTELGEFTDPLKKHVIYGKALDIENIREELGDIMWYVALAATAINVDLSVILAENINKLTKRFPDKFTQEAAIARADKVEDSDDYPWERAAATGVDHIWYSTRSGKYAYSDEAEQLSSNVYDTAADAITALTAYIKQLKLDNAKAHAADIDRANWGMSSIASQQFSCCPITANCTEANAKANCVLRLLKFKLPAEDNAGHMSAAMGHNLVAGLVLPPVNSYCNAEDPFGLNRAADFHDKQRTGEEG